MSVLVIGICFSVCNIDKTSEPGDEANWNGWKLLVECGKHIVMNGRCGCVHLRRFIDDNLIAITVCDFFIAGTLYKAKAKKIKHTSKGHGIISDKHDSEEGGYVLLVSPLRAFTTNDTIGACN